MVIARTLAPRLRDLAAGFPVITVCGPRQSGKTTLCRSVFPDKPYRSLERPDTRAFARDDPRAFLAALPSGAVLDEIQRVPELTSWLQPLVDEDPTPGRFILTGSQNLALTEATTQSLAGRTAIVELLPFSRPEVRRTPHADDDLMTTLWRGGYPAIFDRGLDPRDWLGAYTSTYVERDVRQLLAVGDLEAFQTFLGLCSGRSGSLLNLSDLGRDAGVTHNTARAWLSVLDASYLAYRLKPWHVNLGKRLIKAPKLYLWDSGLMCSLLGIQEPGQLWAHPLRGAVFETWVASEVRKRFVHQASVPRMWFYRDQRKLEADLVVEADARTVLIEVKSSSTIPPRPFRTLRDVQQLWVDAGRPAPELVVLYGGDESQERTDGRIVSWRDVDAVV